MPSSLTRTIQYDNIYNDINQDGTPDIATRTVTLNASAVTTYSNDIVQAISTITSPENRILKINYDRDTLLTQTIQVPCLYDTFFEYNDKGRLSSIHSNTRRLSMTYNWQGLIESITDPKNQTTFYDYDAVGRVTSINRPDGSSLEFGYDFNGNMTLLTNPVSVDHIFTYNHVNLPGSYQTPLSGSYSYVYDKDRNLIQTNLPSGKQIHNIYDRTRLVEIQTPEGNIDFTYSCGGRVESVSKPLYYDLDGLLTGSGAYAINRNAQNGLPESVSGNGLTISRGFNG